MAVVLDLHSRAVVGWSMNRRGNCWDNAVAESFFSNLKSEQIKKRICHTRTESKSDNFDYIEVFTIELDATSISINSAPMSASGSVKLCCKKCLQVLVNAHQLTIPLVNAFAPAMHR